MDFLLENTDPELVKLEDDVFWVQIGGRDTVEFLGVITPEDREILGYNKEAFRLSMSNTITWKDLTLFFLFNGTFSNKKFGRAANNLAYLSYENMQYTNMFNHPFWTEENKT